MAKMCSVENVTPRALNAVIPTIFKGLCYTKLKEGLEIEITKVAYSVYQAKNKETKELIYRKDGTPVTRVTAYIGFDDGLYSTVSNEYAIGQLMSVTGPIDLDEFGVSEFPDIEPCRVKVTTKDIKYGNKSFPSWVFIPIERYKQVDILTGQPRSVTRDSGYL